MNLEDYIYDKSKPYFYVKISICHWHDNNGLHMRKEVRVLKRKSSKGSAEFFHEDCDMGGADTMFKYFKNLDEGEYKVTLHESRDWETGYVEEVTYEIEKV
jgi:hypothetical protein